MSFSGTKGYTTKPKPGVMLNPLHPLSQGLVGYWLFNEGAGSKAYDISGKSNHGALIDMSPNAQDSGWCGSKFGGDLQFNGNNNHVDCGTNNSLCITEAITAAAWIKIAGTGTNKRIFAKYSTTLDKRSFQIFVGISEQITFNLGSPDGTTNLMAESATDLIKLNTWHHVVGTWKIGKTIDIYIDGKEVPSYLTQNTKSNSVNVNDIHFRIGAREEITVPFHGTIGPTSLYEQAKSPAEIKQLYLKPFCNLLQVPIRRYHVITPPVGAIMNQFQKVNLGADLYNGVILT